MVIKNTTNYYNTMGWLASNDSTELVGRSFTSGFQNIQYNIFCINMHCEKHVKLA